MADFPNRHNQSKDFSKKKDYYGNKDFRKVPGYRADRDHFYRKQSYEKNQTTHQPTILLKTRDVNRASSPGTSIKKDVEQPRVTAIATKAQSVENNTPVSMAAPIKFLEFDTGLSDECLEYLSDRMDFLVVGCLGCQGVGKSMILSLLADPSLDLKSGSTAFPMESISTQSTGNHETVGIDLYVTKNRILLLDCQPILVASMDNDDCSTELNSLELAAFLFSVCHVVLFVQDTHFDPDLIRFLQTAEMLKPSTSTTLGETVVEYFSHLVLLHNKADDWEFQPNNIKQIQESYLKMFDHSRLQIQTGFGIANGDVSPNLNAHFCGELINLFLLPNILEDDQSFTGHPGFKALFRHFRNQILSTSRTPITHNPLSEKNWFHYAAKVWDGIQKSTFFNEYHRLLVASQYT